MLDRGRLLRLESLTELALARAGAASASTVRPNGSWQQAAWFIDPQNVSGVASDNNSGIDALHPVKTWNGGVIAKYRTIMPFLRQNITWTFMSSHTDNSDPVIFHPVLEAGSVVRLTGSLGAAQQTGNGNLAGVIAKNRATPQLLTATFGAGTGSYLLVANATHASRAWLYTAAGGGAFTLSQPMVPANIPAYFTGMGEVNTWANGDAYTIYNPVAVNVVDIEPVHADYNAAFDNAFNLHGIALYDPAGIANDHMFIGDLVTVTECLCERTILKKNNTGVDIFTGLWNCAAVGGMMGGMIPPAIAARLAPNFLILGGIFGSTSTFFASANGTILDGDVIVPLLSGSAAVSLQDGSLGAVYLEQGTTLSCVGQIDNNASVVANAVWGKGTLDFKGATRCAWGAGTAVNTFLLAAPGAVKMNGGATASAYDTGADPAVWHAGRSITPAHLDGTVAAGGFAGNAINPGGACLTSGNL